jgi:hypothetical protein
MLILSDRQRAQRRRRIQCVESLFIQMPKASLMTGPNWESKAEERKLGALLLVLDVTYDGGANMGDKVIERLFSFSRESSSRFCIVVLVRLQQRRVRLF